MYMRQAELTNSYYNTLAKNAKTSALIQGISSVAGSAISYGIGHTEKDINGNEYQVSSITDAQRGWNSFYDLSGSGLSLVPGTQNTANNKGVASSVWDMLSSLYDKK
jgi:membrane protein YqaA with SNARE-associated domain